MRLRAAIIIVIISVVSWIFQRVGQARRESQLTVLQQSQLKTLNIEPVEKTLAPDFLLKDLDGTTIRLHDLRGKIVLLNFWATWCPTCRVEMPSMEALHKEFSSQGLAVLAVALRESADDVQSFYKEHHLSFTALLDHNGDASELYQTWSLPTTFLINKRGYIVGKVIGYRDWHNDQSKVLFTALLKESA